MGLAISSTNTYTKRRYISPKVLIFNGSKLHSTKSCNFFARAIPKAKRIKVFASLKCRFPHADVCLNRTYTKLSAEPYLKQGELLCLGESIVLKLVILMRLYFNVMDEIEKERLTNPSEEKHAKTNSKALKEQWIRNRKIMWCIDQDQDQAHELLQYIPRIELQSKSKPGDVERCHHLVFKGEPWFDSERYHYKLFRPLQDLKEYLGEKGYVSSLKPKVDDIVVYFFKNFVGLYCPEHYGRVYRIGKKAQDITVKSKWGKYHVYTHPIEAVHFYYGNLVLFFRKESSAESK